MEGLRDFLGVAGPLLVVLEAVEAEVRDRFEGVVSESWEVPGSSFLSDLDSLGAVFEELTSRAPLVLVRLLAGGFAGDEARFVERPAVVSPW
jgi:hypothetical protein